MAGETYKGKGVTFVIKGKRFNPKEVAGQIKIYRDAVIAVINKAVRRTLREFVDKLRKTRSYRQQQIIDAGKREIAQTRRFNPNSMMMEVVRNRYVDDPFKGARILTHQDKNASIVKYYARVSAGPDDPMRRDGKDYSLFDLLSRGRPAFSIKKSLVLPIWSPPRRTAPNSTEIGEGVKLKQGAHGRFVFVRLKAGFRFSAVQPREWYEQLAKKAEDRAFEELGKAGLLHNTTLRLRLDRRHIQIRLGATEKDLTGMPIIEES